MLVAAAVTGSWAAVVSFAPVLVVVLLAWFGAAISASMAIRFALAVWLLGHGVPFTIGAGQAGAGPIGLVPLALTGLAVWRLVRAGAYTARAVAATSRDVPYVVTALTLTYGAIGGLAAWIASGSGIGVSPVLAVAMTGGIAALASAPGALVETGTARRWWRRFTSPVRDGLRGGVVAALGILSAGAALAGVATAIAYPDAIELYRGYRAGVGGGAGITVVGLAYAPNLMVWAAAYLAGPGFGFGVDTTVSVFQVSLGPLPAIPVLAGLPTGPAPAWAGVLLAVPVLAGMVVGVWIARRRRDASWRILMVATGLSGLVAGVLLAVASFAASGSLGTGQLAEIGPAWWQVGPAVAVAVGLGASLAAISTSALRTRR